MEGRKYTKEQALAVVAECYDKNIPVFIMNAKDIISGAVVKYWAEKLKDAVGADNESDDSYHLADLADKLAVEFLYWQTENPDQVKLPD